MPAGKIPSTPADGAVKTVLVPAVADMSAPKVTELTAATVVDISCYLTPGGLAWSVDQATIDDPRECDRVTRGAPGRKTPSLSITGIDNTNSTIDDNALAETMTEGETLYVVRRRGKDFEDPFASGDVVTVIEFRVGARSEVAVEANSVLRSTWACFVNAYEPEAVVAA